MPFLVVERTGQHLAQRPNDGAAVAEERAVGLKEQHRAVQRADLAFDDAHHEMDTTCLCDLCEASGRRSRHVDRAVEGLAENLAPSADRRPTRGPGAAG